MVKTRIHGTSDHVAVVSLIVAPYTFGFPTGTVEQWLPRVNANPADPRAAS